MPNRIGIVSYPITNSILNLQYFWWVTKPYIIFIFIIYIFTSVASYNFCHIFDIYVFIYFVFIRFYYLSTYWAYNMQKKYLLYSKFIFSQELSSKNHNFVSWIWSIVIWIKERMFTHFEAIIFHILAQQTWHCITKLSSEKVNFLFLEID